jgi:chromosome partitioning protein
MPAKLKDEAIALLSKTKEVAPLLKTTIHQKQAIADAFGQSATVWDLPGRPAESRREYERLFKEIMGMLL